MRQFIWALLLAASSTGALAASPQILALVQTSMPVALVCAGKSCRAELTAFCLQQGRVAPRRGTAYDLAGAGRVTLVLRRGDGTVRRLGVEGLVTFRSARSFAALSFPMSPPIDRTWGKGFTPRLHQRDAWDNTGRAGNKQAKEFWLYA